MANFKKPLLAQQEMKHQDFKMTGGDFSGQYLFEGPLSKQVTLDA